MRSLRVGLVTCVELPEPDHDEPLLLDELRDAGAAPEMIAWDDPSADPSRFDVCVVRSAWNYHAHPQAFLKWVDRAAGAAARSHVFNPPAITRWNHHKRYLLELEKEGVPIVPTHVITQGSDVSLPALMDERSWEDIVIKPAISAASFMTRRFSHGDIAEAEKFLRAVLVERDALVQPFITSVAQHGEISVHLIDGEWTHAVRKRPRFTGEVERVEGLAVIPNPAMVVAQHAVARWRSDLLYARVDLVLDNRGGYCVSEVELIEPSLFLSFSEVALHALVRGIIGRASNEQARHERHAHRSG